MHTRLRDRTRAKIFMNEFNKDIWIKILNNLKVSNGRHLLLVNKYLSDLFLRMNKEKILQCMVRNIYIFKRFNNVFCECDICDISINMPEEYLPVFCSAIQEKSSLISMFAERVGKRLEKELSMVHLPKIFQSRKKFVLNIFWPIYRAGTGDKPLVGFDECVQHIFKCDEILIQTVQRIFVEIETMKCVIVENWVDTKQRGVIEEKWSTKSELCQFRPGVQN